MFFKSIKRSNSKIIIPESNRITGNIGIEYLIFEYRLNIYSEYFQKIEHNLIGNTWVQKCLKLRMFILMVKHYHNVQNL